MAPERLIRRVTWWGFFINIGLSAFKVFAGIAGNSHAVVADGIHSLTDTVTDIAVIAGSFFWAKPADPEHPYGHKRIETTVSIFIGAFLFVAAAAIGWQAVSDLVGRQFNQPGKIALAAAAVSIVCKEMLFRWTTRVGKKIHSVSLAANAWHHRLDALSSIPVFVAVAATMIYPQLYMLDHLAAFVVSLLIVYAASKIISSGFRELIDQGAPRETCEEIRALALIDKNVRHAYNIRTRYAGNRLQVDLHVTVNGDMTVHEGHEVAEGVKKRIIRDGPRVIDVIVHIEPVESVNPEDTCL
jgi:cation diffusion facilitator family transporter